MSQIAQILDLRDLTRLNELVEKYEIAVSSIQQLKQSNEYIPIYLPEIYSILGDRYLQFTIKVLKEEKFNSTNLLNCVISLAIDEKLSLCEDICKFSQSKSKCHNFQINRELISKFIEFKWPEYNALKKKLLDFG